MKANVGGIDRVFRFVAGAALVALAVLGGLASPWNYVAGVAGAMFVMTSLLRFCPLYPVLGISTCKHKQ